MDAQTWLCHKGAAISLSTQAASMLCADRDGDAKSEVIAYAAEHLGITDLSEILMIGDHTNDVLGAAHHSIDCAGVLWGFGGKEALVSAGAKYICETVDDLKALLLNSTGQT